MKKITIVAGLLLAATPFTAVASPVDQTRVRKELDSQLAKLTTATKNKDTKSFMQIHSDGFRFIAIDGEVLDRDEYEQTQSDSFAIGEIKDFALQIDQLAASSNEATTLISLKLNSDVIDREGKWGKAGEKVKTSITGKIYQKWKLIKGSWKLSNAEVVEQKSVVNGVTQPND